MLDREKPGKFNITKPNMQCIELRMAVKTLIRNVDFKDTCLAIISSIQTEIDSGYNLGSTKKHIIQQVTFYFTCIFPIGFVLGRSLAILAASGEHA